MELSDNKNPQQKLGSVAVASVAPKTLTRVSQTLVPNGQPMLIIYIYILFFIDLLLQQKCFTISEGFTNSFSENGVQR